MNIVALSSGVLNQEGSAPLLNQYILGLIRSERPRICYVPTASHDSPESIVAFYEAYPASHFQPSHLTLFNRTVKDLRSFILAQDAVCVAGGNTANLLAIWRLHGLDSIMREAWEQGIVLYGASAGALCWFESGSTDSFGRDLSAIDNCLGFLPGSFCPHYDSEVRRRPTYHRFIAEGLADGWALEDGTALHYKGQELQRIITGRVGAKAYRVEKVDGEVRETAVEPEPLPGVSGNTAVAGPG
jgi:peptidase E